MSRIAPKPIIARTLQTWRVPPGLTFALVEDIERCLWIVESCPAGTHFWTLDQAEQLALGSRTRAAIQAALRAGRDQEQASHRETAKRARMEAPPSYDIPTRHAFPLSRQRQTTRTRQLVDTGKVLVTV